MIGRIWKKDVAHGISEWFESAWAKKVEYPTFSAVGPKDASKKHKAEKTFK